MAGMPPGSPVPGMGVMLPPRPTQPGPPQGMPPPPPPVAPAPMTPPGGMMPPGGPGPASPLAGLFSDLSATMGPGWQQLDIAARAFKTALRSRDFLKSPAVVAVVRSMLNTTTELLSNYTAGTSGGVASPSSQPRDDANPPPSADADAMPPAAGASESASEE